MSISTIKRTAQSKKVGLTRDELEIFVTDLDHAGHPGEAVVKATVGFNGRILTIEASA